MTTTQQPMPAAPATPLERAEAMRQIEACIADGATDAILTLLGDAAIRGLAADWNDGRDGRAAVGRA